MGWTTSRSTGQSRGMARGGMARGALESGLSVAGGRVDGSELPSVSTGASQLADGEFALCGIWPTAGARAPNCPAWRGLFELPRVYSVVLAAFHKLHAICGMAPHSPRLRLWREFDALSERDTLCSAILWASTASPPLGLTWRLRRSGPQRTWRPSTSGQNL